VLLRAAMERRWRTWLGLGALLITSKQADWDALIARVRLVVESHAVLAEEASRERFDVSSRS